VSKVFTSFDTVSRAYDKVRKELWNLGLLWEGSRMDSVDATYLTVAPISAVAGYMGFYQPATQTIEFPSVYLPFQALWMKLPAKAGALDVFRHEFGHALADLYPKALSKGGVFRAAFGGSYGEDPAEERGVDGWEERYVSEYATSATQEDFAETFMLFVKHKGKIPARFARKPAIRKKWKAVEEIVKRVAAATR